MNTMTSNGSIEHFASWLYHEISKIPRLIEDRELHDKAQNGDSGLHSFSPVPCK